MEPVVHFARMQRPTDPFRVVCGCWRRHGNWSDVAARVTCPDCLRHLEAAPAGSDALAALRRDRS